MGPFRPGDRVMLVDRKGRRHLVRLAEGGSFHTHSGPLPHDDLIGQPEGTWARTVTGSRYLAVRPTLAEVVIGMPRGAQVIYPKDLAQILMLADIYPGCRVLEAGVGSGALSMAMLRAGADVTGYELRPDFARRAQLNVADLVGEEGGSRYRVELRDMYEGTELVDLDRLILDLPEPWRVVHAAERALRAGGIFLSYLPTIGQVSALRDVMEESRLGLAQTVEVLVRSWHVEGQSVRPDHRMVAHTGFLTWARLLQPTP